MQGKRETAIADRRARIRAAAKEALLRAPDASMRDIAEDAALSVATLYNLFTNKEAILLDIVEEELDQIDAVLARQRIDDPIERCRAVIEVSVSQFIRHAPLFRPLLGAIERQPTTPRRTAVMQRSASRFAEAIVQGVACGQLFDDVAPEIVARQITWGFVQAIRYWASGDLGHDAFRGQARLVVELALLAIAAPHARGRHVQRLAELTPALSRRARS